MAFASAAVAAATAFNLVCSGTITENSLYNKDKVDPYSYVYRIDLASKKWCEAGCSAVRAIYEIQPGYLILQEPKDVDTIGEYEKARSQIDRTTGAHSIFMTSGRGASILILEWKGKCEKAPFSGFPNIETKF